VSFRAASPAYSEGPSRELSHTEKGISFFLVVCWCLWSLCLSG
jgi:hypothetical protein